MWIEIAILADDLTGGVVRIPRLLEGSPASEVVAALGECVAALHDICKFWALLMTGGDVTAAVFHAIDEPLIPRPVASATKIFC